MPALGVGSTRAPGSLAGIPGESPLPRPVPPDTKRAQEARGARVCQFQRSASDPGSAFVNNLPFFTRPGRGEGLPPHPCKSAAFQEAFETGLGFLSSYFFFGVSFPTSSGPPPPHSSSPLPSLLPHPPPSLPSVEYRGPFRHPRAPALHNSLNNRVLQAPAGAGDLSLSQRHWGGGGEGVARFLLAPHPQPVPKDHSAPPIPARSLPGNAFPMGLS